MLEFGFRVSARGFRAISDTGTVGVMQTERGTTQRSDEIRSRPELARTYVSHRSPQVMLVAVSAVAIVRVAIGGVSWGDLVVVAATAVLLGFVEWVLHLYLLHAPEESRRMQTFKTGAGHREHHLDPNNVGWILLSGIDALVFAVLIAAWTAAWSLPLLWLVGGPLLAPYVTALLVAYLSLAHYEWVHLMVHTRVRPRTRYYRRLASNHRLHHYRNEHYWLGVTSNLGDRVLGTYPSSKSDVPLSETARTLE